MDIRRDWHCLLRLLGIYLVSTCEWVALESLADAVLEVFFVEVLFVRVFGAWDHGCLTLFVGISSSRGRFFVYLLDSPALQLFKALLFEQILIERVERL